MECLPERFVELEFINIEKMGIRLLCRGAECEKIDVPIYGFSDFTPKRYLEGYGNPASEILAFSQRCLENHLWIHRFWRVSMKTLNTWLLTIFCTDLEGDCWGIESWRNNASWRCANFEHCGAEVYTHNDVLNYLGGSKNRGTPKYMVYNGKPY